MTIPTSNKPGEAGDNKIAREAELEKRIVEVAARIKERVSTTDERVAGLEKDKLQTLWDTGKDIVELMAETGDDEKKKIIMRFHTEIGKDPSFFYLCTNFFERFDTASYAAAVKHGMTVRVVKALITIKDEKLREKYIKKAIEEGLNEVDIRNMTGKQGARAGKSRAAAKAKDANKTPLQVFVKGNDRLRMFSETIGSCTDAFGRLAESKTEEARQSAVDQLISYRDGLKAIVNECTTFLKFTNGIESKVKKK